MKIILIYCMLFLMPMLGSAQQLPQFSQYMYNIISINPAFAGSKEVLVINLLNRNQWVGIDGGPVTQTLSLHSSVPNTGFGIGFSAINDKLGYEKTTYAYADVSYMIDLNHKYQLAFGIKGGAVKYSLDHSLLNDPKYATDSFLEHINFNWNPNFGIGLYVRSDYFYVGLSTPKMLNYSNKSNIEQIPLERISYYLNGGFLFELNNDLKFKPTFVIKYTNGAPLSVDLTANFLINEQLWVGGFYRLNDAFGAMVNFKATKALSVGYSYDYTVSAYNPYTLGSHEVMINYQFEFPRTRFKRCPVLNYGF